MIRSILAVLFARGRKTAAFSFCIVSAAVNAQVSNDKPESFIVAYQTHALEITRRLLGFMHKDEADYIYRRRVHIRASWPGQIGCRYSNSIAEKERREDNDYIVLCPQAIQSVGSLNFALSIWALAGFLSNGQTKADPGQTAKNIVEYYRAIHVKQFTENFSGRTLQGVCASWVVADIAMRGESLDDCYQRSGMVTERFHRSNRQLSARLIAMGSNAKALGNTERDETMKRVQGQFVYGALAFVIAHEISHFLDERNSKAGSSGFNDLVDMEVRADRFAFSLLRKDPSDFVGGMTSTLSFLYVLTSDGATIDRGISASEHTLARTQAALIQQNCVDAEKGKELLSEAVRKGLIKSPRAEEINSEVQSFCKTLR